MRRIDSSIIDPQHSMAVVVLDVKHSLLIIRNISLMLSRSAAKTTLVMKSFVHFQDIEEVKFRSCSRVPVSNLKGCVFDVPGSKLIL